jgi:hypothetical protein
MEMFNMEKMKDKLKLYHGMVESTEVYVTEKIHNEFDWYRLISGLLLLVSTMYLFFTDNPFWIYSFMMCHLHILINQLWWKIRNIEYNFIRNENKTN